MLKYIELNVDTYVLRIEASSIPKGYERKVI